MTNGDKALRREINKLHDQVKEQFFTINNLKSLLAAKELVWSKELPTVAGWYWIKGRRFFTLNDLSIMKKHNPDLEFCPIHGPKEGK